MEDNEKQAQDVGVEGTEHHKTRICPRCLSLFEAPEEDHYCPKCREKRACRE